MIISIGEVVWDIFPDRKVLGGAPINVACHLRRLGVEAGVVTRVGADELGDRTIGSLAALGLSVEGVQRGQLPTGTVNVTFDDKQQHRFEIVSPAAWDNIDPQEALKFVGQRPFKMVFGTLGQRDKRSRSAVRALWEKAEQRFYDVNLRPPHTSREVVEESLAVAELVKVNDDELLELGNWYNYAGEDKKDIAHRLMGRYNISVLVVTEGERGAWLLDGDDFFQVPGQQVDVVDTVGAGDAFFAALLAGYIAGKSWQDCLKAANRLGGFVASQHGATPVVPDGFID
jgi:fructokinase